MILATTRWLLLSFAALTLLAFVVLFVFSGATNRYFAWTIVPPVTAAFLGAAYAGGCVLELLAVQSRRWASVRVPFVTILVFTLLSLVTTLLHLDRFHFGSAGAVARFAAWFWLVIYVVVPGAMLAVLVRQERRAGTPVGRSVVVPSALAAVLWAQSLVLFLVGTALFVLPGTASALWPWQLTPLTARMVAAWLLAIAVGTALALRDGDLARLDVAAWSYAFLGLLELVVAVRFAEAVRWSSAAAWGYLAVIVSIVATAGYILRRLHRSSGATASSASRIR